MKRGWIAAGITLGLVLSVRTGWCAALGIPLDGFLQQFQQFVIGMGLVVGMVGLVGYVGSLYDNPFSHILAGSVGFFVKGGMLGGGVALLSLLGLTGGAILL